jgi:biopolymer transport protein ExbD
MTMDYRLPTDGSELSTIDYGLFLLHHCCNKCHQPSLKPKQPPRKLLSNFNTLNFFIMAELNYSPGKAGGRHSLKKMPVRVDLTAMVDLAFLLITFFMLTTVLTKPKAMPVAMPADGPPGPVPETRSMTICLGKNNQAVWYLGLPDRPLVAPSKIGYGKEMLKAIVQMQDRVKRTSKDGLIVVIKPSDYENLVETLDDMKLTGVPSYAIAKISSKDIDMLKQQNVF